MLSLISKNSLSAYAQNWTCQDVGTLLVLCRADSLACTIAGCELPTNADSLCQAYEPSCPSAAEFSQPCICATTTITPYPTAAASTPTPGYATCGSLGQSCCGIIPPLTCDYPYVPSDPTVPLSCVCQVAPTDSPLPDPNCGDWMEPCCTGTAEITLGYQCDPSNDLVTSDVEGVCICVSVHAGESSDIFCPDGVSIKTALGCIPVGSGTNFSAWILRLAIPAGGVVAFIVILIASLQLILSAGDPGKIQAAKGLLTAAISGLVLIILSIFILNLIGFKIFKIPGF